MKIFALLFLDARLSLMIVLRICYQKAADRLGFHLIPLVIIGFLLRPFYRLCQNSSKRAPI